MDVVYILELSNGQNYIGSTNNLERRLSEHFAGKTRSLKFKLPAKLVFYQEFNSISTARKVEYKLKSLKSKIIFKEIIANQKINVHKLFGGSGPVA